MLYFGHYLGILVTKARICLGIFSAVWNDSCFSVWRGVPFIGAKNKKNGTLWLSPATN